MSKNLPFKFPQKTKDPIPVGVPDAFAAKTLKDTVAHFTVQFVEGKIRLGDVIDRLISACESYCHNTGRVQELDELGSGSDNEFDDTDDAGEEFMDG